MRQSLRERKEQTLGCLFHNGNICSLLMQDTEAIQEGKYRSTTRNLIVLGKQTLSICHSSTLYFSCTTGAELKGIVLEPCVKKRNSFL